MTDFIFHALILLQFAFKVLKSMQRKIIDVFRLVDLLIRSSSLSSSDRGVKEGRNVPQSHAKANVDKNFSSFSFHPSIFRHLFSKWHFAQALWFVSVCLI